MIILAEYLRSVVDNDGAVILDIPHNTMTTLDSTGAYVWEQLRRGVEVDAIIKKLASETHTDEEVVCQDVNSFIEQLKSKQLVSVQSETFVAGKA
jgi:hypothetical protein